MSLRRIHDLCEAGETLLELLISVTLLGIATVAILGSMTSSIDASVIHQKQSVAGDILDDFSEYLQDEVKTPYLRCPGADTSYQSYRNAFVGLLTTSSSSFYEPLYAVSGTPRYSVTLSVSAATLRPAADGISPNTVSYSSCGATVAGDAAATSGLQRLTLTVTSVDTKVDEKAVIVKRAP